MNRSVRGCGGSICCLSSIFKVCIRHHQCGHGCCCCFEERRKVATERSQPQWNLVLEGMLGPEVQQGLGRQGLQFVMGIFGILSGLYSGCHTGYRWRRKVSRSLIRVAADVGGAFYAALVACGWESALTRLVPVQLVAGTWHIPFQLSDQ